MKIRYQADADLNKKIISATIRLEPAIDFRTAHAAGISRLSDPEVLELAAREGRILVTHDKATMPWHFAQFIATSTSPGVFIIVRGLKIGDIAEELVLIYETSEPDEWANRIAYIPM